MEIPQGSVVNVRRAQWRVVDVRAFERCRLLTLAGLGPAHPGVAQRVLEPFDVVERVERRSRLARMSRRAWLRALRAAIVAETPPSGLQCARLARMDVLPYQLEPALAIVNGLASRVLLADDVGLGK